MVTTRSQSNGNSRIERTELGTFSNDDNDTSVAELSSRNYIREYHTKKLCYLGKQIMKGIE